NLHYDVPFIRLNEKPGLGIEINEDTLQELTVFQDVVR
ncbi:dipeptide epimerase, partial [Klebsiella pneumoniae]|nr:dipeptide epimerase [Klebsiella pneumoniae]